MRLPLSKGFKGLLLIVLTWAIMFILAGIVLGRESAPASVIPADMVVFPESGDCDDCAGSALITELEDSGE